MVQFSYYFKRFKIGLTMVYHDIRTNSFQIGLRMSNNGVLLDITDQVTYEKGKN